MNHSEKAPVSTDAMKCKGRQDRFDYLRIIGVILVTVQHVLTLTWKEEDLSEWGLLGTGMIGQSGVAIFSGQSHVSSMNNLRVASQLQSYPSHIAYVYLELHL